MNKRIYSANSDKLNKIHLKTNSELNRKIDSNYIYDVENIRNDIENKDKVKKLIKKLTLSNNNSDKNKSISEFLLKRNTSLKAKNLDILLKRKEVIYNILIIDDSITIRSSCKFILLKLEKIRNCKMQIDEADDGFAGLNQIINKLLLNKKYDLIILDDEMIFLNGTELIKMMGLIIDKKFGEKIGLKKELFDKFVLCSANPDNLNNKIGINSNFKICPKPINLKFLQNYFDELK